MKVTLTTTGRRSGEPRTVALYAFEDGDRLVITGSRGGAAKDPSWAENLRAYPKASVKRGRTTIEVTAREVDGAERDRLWQVVTEGFPLYATYQKRTKRRIPLFLLDQVDD